jgi:hypothetical protein
VVVSIVVVSIAVVSVEMTFQFAAILSPIHNKTNIFKNEKIYSSFSPWPRNVLLGVGGGAEFFVESRYLAPGLLNSSEAGRGMEKKSGAGRNEPDAWVYSGEKGLVPTFAERLLGQGEEVSVESRLAIDDDLIIGNYTALHCKKSCADVF